MKVAIIQLTSVLDYKVNLLKIDELIKKGKKDGANHFFLPEVYYSMSNGLTPTPYLIEEGNEHFNNIKNLAKANEVYLIGGSAATKVEDKIVNRSYNFDPKGNLLLTYDKIHLFRVNLPGTNLDEGKVYTAGSKPELLKLGDFTFGLSICFDLRFPELFRYYMKEGANVLVIPAAFTKPTGEAHWHTLLRARAIENQCFVIASAQVGEHNERIKTYGHSLVVDPWGEILVDAKEEVGVFVCDLDLKRLEEVRSRMDVTYKGFHQ